ncbi:hypothetical protein D3C85_1422180 [compost metagenome]
MNERFGCANRTLAGHQSPNGRVEDMDFPHQRAAGAAERMPFPVFDQYQLTVFELRQLPKHASAQQRSAQAMGAEQTGFEREARGFHGGGPWGQRWRSERCHRQPDEQIAASA